MKKAYIVSAVRTPLGSFGGQLSSLSAVKLGSIAIKAAIEKAKISPDQVQEVLFGNVVSANLGQAPARQAAIGAGIGNEVPCTTINKVCSSGLKSVMLAAQSIQLGHNDVMVAGGMESMSNIPYYADKNRWGAKYGDVSLIDGLSKDGLSDAYDHIAMGNYADRTAEKYQMSREDQDAFAQQSYERSQLSTQNGWFSEEIAPVAVPQRKGDPIIIDKDEEPYKVKFEKIPQLRPAFSKTGTVTAANASTINDGASALVIASEDFVKKHNLQPLAAIVSYADAAHEPEWFTTAPPKAAQKALDSAKMTKENIDFYEVNEAFSVVAMAFAKEMEVSEEKMNVHGGSVSLGHPLGASGARILTTLCHVLRTKKAKNGLAAICNGGGGASAMVIESA